MSYSWNSNSEADSDQIYLQYVPVNFSTLPPPPPSSIQDIYNNPYYYVQSYQIIVDMMNNALSQAMQSLIIKAASFGQVLPSTNPPFFEFDPENSKFILSGDVLSCDLGHQITYQYNAIQLCTH